MVLTSLFFKKISNNGTRGQGRNLRVLKESKKKWIRQLQCQEQCIDHIRYYLSGLSSAHFFEKTFLEIAVYIEWFSFECRKTKTKVITLANHIGHRQYIEPIKTRSNYMWLTQSAGRCMRARHNWLWFYF